MRLLQFQPDGYRNLRNLPVIFTLSAETPSLNGCSIRFLVGRNGTGKTTLIRFIAAIFAALDEDYQRARPDNPAYNVPFMLQYELGGAVITINSSGSGRSGLRFLIDGIESEYPSKDRILPRALLISTSGDMDVWLRTLNSDVREEAEESEPLPEIINPAEEHAPWQQLSTDEQEQATPEAPGDEVPEVVTDNTDASDTITFGRVVLVAPEHLPLALLSAWIGHLAERDQDKHLGADFGPVLEHVDLMNLVHFSLRLSFNERDIAPDHAQRLRRLYPFSTLPLNQFDEQLWGFDLNDYHEGSLASRMMPEIDQRPFQPFQLFRDLVQLYDARILRQVNLVISKQIVEGEQLAESLMLAASLSDGERAYLGRMALIHLIRMQECLFLFDEPETHFNDSWKRELVDQIEQMLKNTQSEVVLTTHASITLTDAFPDEVVLLTERGQVRAPLTLATEPGELLRSVFEADEGVGERARERLNATLRSENVEDLRGLLKQVGPGYFRVRIVERLLELGALEHVSQDL